MVCSYSGLLGNDKEDSIDTLNNIDDPQNIYVGLQKSFEKEYIIPLYVKL